MNILPALFYADFLYSSNVVFMSSFKYRMLRYRHFILQIITRNITLSDYTSS